MRTLGLLLVFGLAVQAGDPVSDDDAKNALSEFEKGFKSKVVEERQNAVFNLHAVPHDLVLKRLEKALKDRDPKVRNVVALAIGGQNHNVPRAGKVLMKAYKKEFKNSEVFASVLDAIGELKFMGYWPQAEPLLKDKRNSIVIRTLELLGSNKDWRALPRLLEMYKVAMPKRVSWKTGTVNVDTGAAGDKDQKAAEAKFNAKYGKGGSKAKAKAARKARSFDERNFDSQLRSCVKGITGESFDNAFDFEDWYIENYIEIAKKVAALEGKDEAKAVAQAKKELPEKKRALEEQRKKIEEQLAKQREAENK